MVFDVDEKIERISSSYKNLQELLTEADKSLNEFDLNYAPKNYWDLKEQNIYVPIQNSFLGGPFLPEKKSGQVEIVSINLSSTTGDVLSISAKQTKSKIVYEINDEYEGSFSLGIKSSQKPLTMKKIIQLIDTSELDDAPGPEFSCIFGGTRDWNYEEGGDDPIRYWDFETVHSDFYPDLNHWYKIKNFIWLIEKKIERLKN